MRLAQRRTLCRAALFCSLLMPVFHVFVLSAAGLNAVVSPISALSQSDFGWLHTVGLILFGIAHWCLAASITTVDNGRLWPWAQRFLFVSGVLLLYIAWFFAYSNVTQLKGEAGNDPLWLVACTTGFAMGALQPGLSRSSPRLALFSGACLGIWLWLVPLALFVTDSWVGAYERLVGMVYVIWLTGVSIGLHDRFAGRSATAG